MSELESIGKLRAAGRNMAKGRNLENHEECNLLLVIADEIEAEVAESYMRLPLDADGVPIRVGETLQLGDTRGKVVALTYCPSNGKLPWEWQCDTGDWYNTAFAHHVKPRTLEDVLREMLDREGDGIGLREFNRDFDAFVEHYADEIRAMFGEVDE